MGMLCLSRNADEAVIIDNGETRIRVTLLSIRGPNRARLGFEAPLHVKIRREELLDPGERDRERGP